MAVGLRMLAPCAANATSATHNSTSANSGKSLATATAWERQCGLEDRSTGS